MSGGHGKWVSWDRTSILELCEREDPCLGLFVFPALSPTAGRPRPAAAVATSLNPGPTALPAAGAPAAFYLLRAKRSRTALPIHLFDLGLTSDPSTHSYPPCSQMEKHSGAEHPLPLLIYAAKAAVA